MSKSDKDIAPKSNGEILESLQHVLHHTCNGEVKRKKDPVQGKESKSNKSVSPPSEGCEDMPELYPVPSGIKKQTISDLVAGLSKRKTSSPCPACSCCRQSSSSSPQNHHQKKSSSPSSSCNGSNNHNHHHASGLSKKGHSHPHHHHHHHQGHLNNSQHNNCTHSEQSSSKHSSPSGGLSSCLLHTSSVKDHFHDSLGRKHNHPPVKQQSMKTPEEDEEEDDDDDNYEDCDDEYEDEEDDDDDDDEEGDEDESGSECMSDDDDASSASGYTNSRDGNRVCDCCYCEVFGHGMPPFMSHTSRNYSEMKERLRQKLSQRKAEETTHPSDDKLSIPGKKQTGNSIKTRSISPVPKEDNRDLEELVNFIEGSKGKKGTKAKANNNNKEVLKEKDKVKQKDKKKKPETIPVTTVSASSPKNHNLLLSVPSNDSKPENNGSFNVSPSSSSSKTGHKENQSSNGSRNVKKSNGKGNDVKSSSCSPSRTPNSVKGSTKINGNKSMTPDESVQRSQSSNGVTVSSSSSKTNGNNVKNKKDDGKKKGKQNGNKRTSDIFPNDICPEEVFKPKDVNLETNDLDDVEKELEAFKRFCFDSKPAPQKEKICINVNLKDIFGKKTSNSKPIRINGST